MCRDGFIRLVNGAFAAESLVCRAVQLHCAKGAINPTTNKAKNTSIFNFNSFSGFIIHRHLSNPDVSEGN